LAELFELVQRTGAAHVRFNIETKLTPTSSADVPEPDRFANALAAAVRAARNDHATLTLIAVADDVLSATCRWPQPAMPNPHELQADADAGAAEVLRDAVARLPEDIPVTTIQRRGKAGPEIVAEAGSGKYDAILLGARGVGRIGALIGSVSQYVLHHAETAVFVAHAPRGR
jgi:nucleotide-binding universal stress UspA family protein